MSLITPTTSSFKGYIELLNNMPSNMANQVDNFYSDFNRKYRTKGYIGGLWLSYLALTKNKTSIEPQIAAFAIAYAFLYMDTENYHHMDILTARTVNRKISIQKFINIANENNIDQKIIETVVYMLEASLDVVALTGNAHITDENIAFILSFINIDYACEWNEYKNSIMLMRTQFDRMSDLDFACIRYNVLVKMNGKDLYQWDKIPSDWNNLARTNIRQDIINLQSVMIDNQLNPPQYLSLENAIQHVNA